MTDSFRPTVIRNKAWAALRGKWGMAAVAALAIFAIMGVVQLISSVASVAGPIVNLAITFFVTSIIAIGTMFLFLDVSRGKDIDFNTIAEPTKNGRYMNYVLGYLLVAIFTFLWSLLLVIPGIIKGISYSMTFFIMRENPELTPSQAIDRSMEMMEGHKMEYFLLGLSFIGWILLGFITFGIGLLFVYPYIYTATGAFYDELKKDYEARKAFGAAPAAPAAE